MKKLILSILAIILIYHWYWPDFELKITFFDIGQGDSFLIRTPNGVNILIDGGPDNTLLYEISKALPWWDRKIDYVIVSHWHLDHYLGLIALSDKYEIKNYLVNGTVLENSLIREWQLHLDSNTNITKVVSGDRFEISEETFFEVLHSDDNPEGDLNNNSVVIKFYHGENQFLFTGDMPSEIEEELIASGIDFTADVLKVGHHGSRYSSSVAFLEQVSPDICVIQSGTDNKFKHPHLEAVQRLESIGCQTLSTQEKGTIVLWSDGVDYQLDSNRFIPYN